MTGGYQDASQGGGLSVSSKSAPVAAGGHYDARWSDPGLRVGARLTADVTAADIMLNAFADSFTSYGMDLISAAPELKSAVDAVSAHPALTAYFATRATVEAKLAAPGLSVEIMVQAAK